MVSWLEIVQTAISLIFAIYLSMLGFKKAISKKIYIISGIFCFAIISLGIFKMKREYYEKKQIVDNIKKIKEESKYLPSINKEISFINKQTDRLLDNIKKIKEESNNLSSIKEQVNQLLDDAKKIKTENEKIKNEENIVNHITSLLDKHRTYYNQHKTVSDFELAYKTLIIPNIDFPIHYYIYLRAFKEAGINDYTAETLCSWDGELIYLYENLLECVKKEKTKNSLPAGFGEKGFYAQHKLKTDSTDYSEYSIDEYEYLRVKQNAIGIEKEQGEFIFSLSKIAIDHFQDKIEKLKKQTLNYHEIVDWKNIVTIKGNPLDPNNNYVSEDLIPKTDTIFIPRWILNEDKYIKNKR